MVQALAQEMEWIARILQGERDLFHELIRPYERAVFLTAVSVLRDAAEAEDAAQEAMIKAYRGLGSFRGDAKFSTWLTSITLNEARSRLRKSARVRWSRSTTGSRRRTTRRSWWPTGARFRARRWSARSLARHIESAIEGLPPSYREVFLLRDKEEMSIEEIAQALGVKANLVKVRLFRARMMLQKQLAPYLKRELPQRRRWFSWLGGRA